MVGRLDVLVDGSMSIRLLIAQFVYQYLSKKYDWFLIVTRMTNHNYNDFKITSRRRMKLFEKKNELHIQPKVKDL
jgi:ABC-type antimicrobial peptide transport system ATPase subunit